MINKIIQQFCKIIFCIFWSAILYPCLIIVSPIVFFIGYVAGTSSKDILKFFIKMGTAHWKLIYEM